MGWLKKAAKKVKKAVNKVADKVADAIETAGNKAQDALEKAADTVRGSVPIIGPAAAAFLGWGGAIVSGAADVFGALVKGLGSSIGGLVAGILLILSGDFKNGLREILSGFVGGVLLVVGKFVSLVQGVLGLERRERRLTEKEAAMLRNVFRESLALYNIRVIEGRSGVFDFNGRPFTMGNTIYMKRTEQETWNESLVHEAAHVWHYHNLGSSYSSDALGAQVYYEHVRSADAYDWWDPAVNGGNMVWEEWNREAQARFIEDVYTDGESNTGQGWVRGDGRFYGATGTATLVRFTFNATDYTPVADEAVQALRAERSVRGSLTM